MNLNALLQQAIHDFQTGNWDESKKKFKKILVHAPQHLGTLNYLSIIYTHEKKYLEAETLFKKIFAIDQSSAQSFYNYSLVLKFLKKYALALSAVEKAIKIQGYSEEYYLQLGAIQELLDNDEAAFDAYDFILTKNPNLADALHGKGKLFLKQDNAPAAQTYFQAGLKSKPDFEEANIGLGEALFIEKNYTQSVAAFEKIHPTSDHRFAALKGMAKAYTKLNNLDQAIICYNQALELNKEDEDLYILYINDLMPFRRTDEVRLLIKKALNHIPHSSYIYATIGSLHLLDAEFDKSEKFLSKSLKIDSQNVYALINFGSLYTNLDKPELALSYLQQASEKLKKNDKTNVELIKYFMSFQYFKLGELSKAYTLHESGLNPILPHSNFRHPQRQFHCPRWEGQPLPDKRLMIWSEQGLGDQLYFLSCIPDIENLCPNLIIEVDARLVEPIQRSFPKALVRGELYQPDGPKYPLNDDFDYHVPMGSLMMYVRPDLQSYERSGPYLTVDQDKKAKFEKRISPYHNTLLVGLCWRSGLIDRLRSLHYFSIQDFKSFFEMKGVTFVNLQYSDYADELKLVKDTYGVEILQWDDFDLKNDLDDVMALMSQLDLIISAPTAVQSIAAAIGQPVIMLAKQRIGRHFGAANDPWFQNSLEVPFYSMDSTQALNLVTEQLDKHYEKKLGRSRH